MMNKSLMLPRAKFYSDMGLSVILMDLRARGASTGRRTGGMGEGNIPDVEAVVNYYMSHYKKYGKLIGYGFSHGGRAIIHTAASHSHFERLILESTPYSLADGMYRQFKLPERPKFEEENIDGALASMPKMPILLIIGDNDTAIIPKEGNELLKHSKSKKSQIVIFPKTAHDVVIDQNKEKVISTIKAFLDLK